MAGDLCSIEEARARLQAGTLEAAEEVLAWAVQQPREVRAALAAHLRPHLLALRERALPAILASDDAEPVKAGLELLAAWERVVLLPEVLPLLRHADAEVRAWAYQALPYVVAPGEAAGEVLRALAEESSEVRRAACVAATRWRLEAAVPLITDLLRASDPELVEAAARALTEMGARGLEALERELTAEWHPAAAAAALEALEEVRSIRYGYARL